MNYINSSISQLEGPCYLYRHCPRKERISYQVSKSSTLSEKMVNVTINHRSPRRHHSLMHQTPLDLRISHHLLPEPLPGDCPPMSEENRPPALSINLLISSPLEMKPVYAMLRFCSVFFL